MKKNWAILSISLLAICACSSVLIVAYVIISNPFYTPPATLVYSPPLILQTPAVAILDFPPTLTPTPTLITLSISTAVTYKGDCLTYVDYVSKTGSLGKSWADTMRDLGSLLERVGKTPDLLSDPSWQAKVEIDLTKIETVAYQFQAFKAPRGLLKVDAQLKGAASEALAITSDIRDGINNMNTTALNDVTTHINNLDAYMNKATDELKTASKDNACP